MSRVYFQHSIADFSHSGPQIRQSALGLNETAELSDRNMYFLELLCIIVVDLVVLNNRCLLSHTFFVYCLIRGAHDIRTCVIR